MLYTYLLKLAFYLFCYTLTKRKWGRHFACGKFYIFFYGLGFSNVFSYRSAICKYFFNGCVFYEPFGVNKLTVYFVTIYTPYSVTDAVGE